MTEKRTGITLKEKTEIVPKKKLAFYSRILLIYDISEMKTIKFTATKSWTRASLAAKHDKKKDRSRLN